MTDFDTTSTDEPSNGSEDEPPSGLTCADAERLGSFRVYLAGDRTIAAGAISDAVPPVVLTEVLQSDAGCELIAPRNLFCSESCGSGRMCAGDDVCVDSPKKVSAGVITVDGLLSEVEVKPNGITFDYSSTVLEPYPAFEPGAAVALDAPGEDTAPFSLQAWGVPPMVTELEAVDVASGSAVELTWGTDNADLEQSEVYISLTVNAHGATTGWIECVTEDDGQFEIPAALMTQLIEMGLSGFPRMTLTRRSTDTADVSGACVELTVSSEVTLDLAVDGLISCNTDEDCPDGSTCSAELACE